MGPTFSDPVWDIVGLLSLQQPLFEFITLLIIDGHALIVSRLFTHPGGDFCLPAL